MRNLLPRSLRSRLILSFGALIFLSLFLAGTTTVYLLKAEQEKTARERVGRLAEPIALRSAFLEASGYSPAEIEKVLANEYQVRILLVDSSDIVLSDTGQTLQGTKITSVVQPAEEQPNAPSPSDPRFVVREVSEGPDDFVFFTAPSVLIPLRSGFFRPSYQTVVAVKASDISQAWRDLLPRFILAGGISFLASVLAAGILARSITRPLRSITNASEEMARGNYDQQLPITGRDEVGRLAQAFNEMALQVSRSNRRLRDFLANVSHELKTPLTSVQGFSQAMIDGSITSQKDYEEAARIINDESVRMRGLVDDLLYLSQVEAGEFDVHLDRLNPNELMRSTRERFERRATQANVTLVVDTRRAPTISGDPRRLEQAVANIVDNAVRHTPAGGQVTLKTSAENGHVRLAVHNTGSVIPEEALPRIFDRFFQADEVGARADANTGLGLAITKEIVEAHGGEVSVTSSPGAGTEFSITLPVNRTAQPSVAVEEDEPHPAPAPNGAVSPWSRPNSP